MEARALIIQFSAAPRLPPLVPALMSSSVGDYWTVLALSSDTNGCLINQSVIMIVQSGEDDIIFLLKIGKVCPHIRQNGFSESMMTK